MFHYDGSQWNQRYVTNDVGVQTIWGDGTGRLWAGGHNLFMEYRDGFWEKLQTNLPQGTQIMGLFGRSATEIYAACVLSDGVGAVLSWDGVQWAMEYQSDWQDLYTIWGDNSQIVVAGEFGLVVRHDGQSWENLLQPSETTINTIWHNSSGDLYFGGDSGMIRHFDGTNWNTMTTPVTASIRGLWGNGSGEMYAVGDESTILHYTNGSWKKVLHSRSGLFDSYSAIWGASADDITVVGYPGIIYHFDGSLWSVEDSAHSVGVYNFSCIWAESAHDIYFGSESGAIFHKGGPEVWLAGKVVTDSLGRMEAISGASVALTKAGGDPVANMSSDSGGEFLFTEVPDGTYALTVTANNMTTVVVPGVQVSGSAVRLSDIVLSLAKIDGTFTQDDIDQAVAATEAAKESVIAMLEEGDLDRDGDVDAADLNAYAIAYGATLFLQPDLDQAVENERMKWDISGDNQVGLKEAINALQVVSGVRGGVK